MIPDIEPIPQVLSNCMQQIPLSDEETNLMRGWLSESEANESLSGDVNSAYPDIASLFPFHSHPHMKSGIFF